MTIRRDVPQPIQVSIVMISQINCLSLKRGKNTPPAPRLCGPMALKRALISKYYAKAVHEFTWHSPLGLYWFCMFYLDLMWWTELYRARNLFYASSLHFIWSSASSDKMSWTSTGIDDRAHWWWGDIFRQISHKYYINNTSASLAVLRQNVSHSVCRSSFNDSYLFRTTQCCPIAADFISYTLWRCAM